MLALPPASVAVAWGLAVFKDRRGECAPCARWRAHGLLPALPGEPGPADPTVGVVAG
jgi:hypothetical protein